MKNQLQFIAPQSGKEQPKQFVSERLRALVEDVPQPIDLFVLGADDPEMAEIETLLMLYGKRFEYATCNNKRVHPGNAYEADPVNVKDGSTIALIECSPTNLLEQGGVQIITIDHHRPDDPGFSLPASKFWEASSIGQLYKLLALGKPTHEHIVLAAMDHCMVQARQGKCPGVDPEEVKLLGRQYIATRNGVDLPWLEECIRVMRTQIIASPHTTVGMQDVVDFTGMPIGVGYSLEYLCMQEALADLGLAALVATKNRFDEPDKVVLCGAVMNETVESFKSSWAPEHGLIRIYGVPGRGYAGGYRK